MIARFRLVLVLCALIPATAVLMVLQYALLKLNSNLARRLPVYWHRMVLHALGFRVSVKGQVSRERPLLLVSNHVSWSDIPVLGAVTELCFIAKQEVNSMAVANLLARLQRSVFVKRESRGKAVEQAREITERLVSGDAMVLFAEGTTGDGNRVLPFKSALLGAAQYAITSNSCRSVSVQPVSIAYTRLHGVPMGRYERAQTSWPGLLEIVPHAKNLLFKAAWDVEVTFGDPRPYYHDTDRRRLTRDIREDVRSMYLGSVRPLEPARSADRYRVAGAGIYF